MAGNKENREPFDPSLLSELADDAEARLLQSRTSLREQVGGVIDAHTTALQGASLAVLAVGGGVYALFDRVRAKIGEPTIRNSENAPTATVLYLTKKPRQVGKP